MATDPDVMQLVAILDAEGFGWLAGELLAEVNVGPEVAVARPSAEDFDPGTIDDDPETDIRRKPIAEAEQFEFAMGFLRDRLVQPVRLLAGAERIAGEVDHREPLEIQFVPPERLEDSGPVHTRAPGDDSLADKLDGLLGRLPALRTPPEASAT